VPPAGIEPSTYALRGRRANALSDPPALMPQQTALRALPHLGERGSSCQKSCQTQPEARPRHRKHPAHPRSQPVPRPARHSNALHRRTRLRTLVSSMRPWPTPGARRMRPETGRDTTGVNSPPTWDRSRPSVPPAATHPSPINLVRCTSETRRWRPASRRRSTTSATARASRRDRRSNCSSALSPVDAVPGPRGWRLHDWLSHGRGTARPPSGGCQTPGLGARCARPGGAWGGRPFRADRRGLAARRGVPGEAVMTRAGRALPARRERSRRAAIAESRLRCRRVVPSA
jgi:hypothetical protein